MTRFGCLATFISLRTGVLEWFVIGVEILYLFRTYTKVVYVAFGPFLLVIFVNVGIRYWGLHDAFFFHAYTTKLPRSMDGYKDNNIASRQALQTDRILHFMSAQVLR